MRTCAQGGNPVHPRLSQIQWLFLDPSVILNETETEREARRRIVTALSRRGRPVDLEQVERAWMQAIASPRPIHPLAGAVQILSPDPATAAAVLDEVLRTTPNRDMLHAGVQLALHTLQSQVKVGLIGPYRMPGVRAQLVKFHLNFPVVALSDEQKLSHQLDPSGRPDPALFVWALRRAGCLPAQAAFASDRVDLGLAPAKLAGLTTVWVRLGNYRLRHPRNAAETPDLTVNGLNELA
jgi:FMN phosphatase YigB (HAD superfamily)